MRLTSWFLAILESLECLLRHYEHLCVAWASGTVSLRSNGGTVLLLILSSAVLEKDRVWAPLCRNAECWRHSLSSGRTLSHFVSSTLFYVVRTLLWSALHPMCLPFLSGCIPGEVMLGKTRDQGWLDSFPPGNPTVGFWLWYPTLFLLMQCCPAHAQLEHQPPTHCRIPVYIGILLQGFPIHPKLEFMKPNY